MTFENLNLKDCLYSYTGNLYQNLKWNASVSYSTA